MLAEHRLKAFQELVTQSSREELIWMNGFLAGLVSAEEKAAGAGSTATPVASATRVNKISILFGTETGNSKKVATEFAAQAKKHGVNVKLISLDKYSINDLAKEEYTFMRIIEVCIFHFKSACQCIFHFLFRFVLRNFSYFAKILQVQLSIPGVCSGSHLLT